MRELDAPDQLPLRFAWHNSQYLGAAHGYTGLPCVLFPTHSMATGIFHSLLLFEKRFPGTRVTLAEGTAPVVLRDLVLQGAVAIAQMQLPSGNFPSKGLTACSESTTSVIFDVATGTHKGLQESFCRFPANCRADELVQWCHGATGVGIFLCAAFEVGCVMRCSNCFLDFFCQMFRESNFLIAALRANGLRK